MIPFLCESMANNFSEEADLGRFSEAIYKKITADAKNQRFQGFRPGTIPPHLEPTYRAFAMDECARETVLEAMQQNNIKPFESSRNNFLLENFCIPPPTKKKAKKKKKKKNSTEKNDEDAAEEPKWLTFENMKGAVDAGWKVRSCARTIGVVRGYFYIMDMHLFHQF